jgi:hypothetical protein
MYAARLCVGRNKTEEDSMRRTLLLFSFVVASTAGAPFASAAPGAVRCGKLLDVRSGRMLTDQLVVFDANGTITPRAFRV